MGATRAAALLLLLGLVGGLLLSVAALELLWGPWRFVHEPLHATVETLGGLTALLLAALLLQRKRERYGGTRSLVATGFLSMGLLDLFHAASVPGQRFVLLHSAAGLSGSFVFALAWMPSRASDGDAAWKKSLPWVVTVGAVSFGTWTLLASDTLPVMVRDGAFTAPANALNWVAGGLFLAGAARLLIDFIRFDRAEGFLFGCTAALFGLGSLMFPFSALWDNTWWMWHVVRLTAYLVILVSVVRQYQRTTATLGVALAERQQAEEKLRNSGARYRMIFEQSPAGIVLIDPATALPLEFNEIAHRQLGYSAEEFARLRISDYEALETPQETTARIEKILRHGRDDFATKHRTKHGEVRDVLVTVQTLEISGRALFHCVFRDVTELKRAQDAIRRLNEELEQRVHDRTAELVETNKELEAFTYSVAHDLRAPLRQIEGFSRLLAEETGRDLRDSAQHHLVRIREGTRLMSQLIEDLLKLSRVGRQGLHLQVTDLNALVTEVLTQVKRDTEGRAIEWRLQPLPFADCDPGLIREVFANLIANAAKFTRPREPAMIEVGTIAIEGRPAIFVRDNGVGFSMRYADKLFGIFQRLHRAEDFEGTGVGLATVQRIVHRHGGRVWAEAELNRGATFYFTLGALEQNGSAEHAGPGGAV